jgi:hypothetical protein
MSTKDTQVGGDHYAKHRIQPWDIIEEYDLDYFEGNAIKYILRRKDPAKRGEDVRKAIHYLEHVCQRLGKKSSDQEKKTDLARLVKLFCDAPGTGHGDA